MTRLPAFCMCVVLMGCQASCPNPFPVEDAGVTGSPDAGRHAVPLCPDFVDNASPLSIQAVGEAFAWGLFRRELRFHEAAQPGFSLRITREAMAPERVQRGEACPQQMFEAGRILFEHTFSRAEGWGNRVNSPARASPFRRVHEGRFGGPDTVACVSCHWRGGVGGAGAVTDNSLILGDGDTVDSADARNPPALVGAGLAQLLAQEMTAQLHEQRDAAVRTARDTGQVVGAALIANGVSFGTVMARPDGTVDTSAVEGVDADLIIKPFGWKGTFATLPAFIQESLQVHLGIQADDLLVDHEGETDILGPGPAHDPDQDGVTHELSGGQLQALAVFLALLDIPVVRPPDTMPALGPPADKLPAPVPRVYTDEWVTGRNLFHSVGCATCHVPMMVVRDPVLRVPSSSTGTDLAVDLSRNGLGNRPTYDVVEGGYPVWAFSDFKRHDLGEEAAALHVDHGVAPTVYLTRRLWGMAQSAPYFYDGRAPTIDAAIAGHGGEGATARDAFNALTFDEKGAMRIYLLSLRRERRPLVP